MRYASIPSWSQGWAPKKESRNTYNSIRQATNSIPNNTSNTFRRCLLSIVSSYLPSLLLLPTEKERETERVRSTYRNPSILCHLSQKSRPRFLSLSCWYEDRKCYKSEKSGFFLFEKKSAATAANKKEIFETVNLQPDPVLSSWHDVTVPVPVSRWVFEHGNACKEAARIVRPCLKDYYRRNSGWSRTRGMGDLETCPGGTRTWKCKKSKLKNLPGRVVTHLLGIILIQPKGLHAR